MVVKVVEIRIKCHRFTLGICDSEWMYSRPFTWPHSRLLLPIVLLSSEPPKVYGTRFWFVNCW